MTAPFHIVFVEPEIPQNTGTTARLCAATGAVLDLVHPLGFSTSARAVRRAGLDYWEHVTVVEHESWERYLDANPEARRWIFTTAAPTPYTDADFAPGDHFIFGRESNGLPASIRESQADRALRIPIRSPHVRSLNLANAAAIVLYEAVRQCRFGRPAG